MALIVQKYGGSSVATAERIKAVAARVGKVYDGGDQVLVVVSAMGDTTDDLIKLAGQVTSDPHPREMDVLLPHCPAASCGLPGPGCELRLQGAIRPQREEQPHRFPGPLHLFNFSGGGIPGWRWCRRSRSCWTSPYRVRRGPRARARWACLRPTGPAFRYWPRRRQSRVPA